MGHITLKFDDSSTVKSYTIYDEMGTEIVSGKGEVSRGQMIAMMLSALDLILHLDECKSLVPFSTTLES